MEAIVSRGPAPGKEKKLLEQMRDVMRVKHYRLRTERTYCDWVERFIRFHAQAGPRSGDEDKPQAGSMRYLWRHPREEEGKTQAGLRPRGAYAPEGSMRYVWRHPRAMGEAEVSPFPFLVRAPRSRACSWRLCTLTTFAQ